MRPAPATFQAAHHHLAGWAPTCARTGIHADTNEENSEHDTSYGPRGNRRGAARPALDRTGGVAKPVLDGRRPPGESALVYFFTLVPMLALVAAVPMAWARV